MTELRSNQQVLDPFERVEEEALFENILQHLTGSELLKVTEVSHRYNQIVSESKRCLNKIVLVVNEETIDSDFDDFQRAYRHLRASDSGKKKKPALKENVSKQLVIVLQNMSPSLISIDVQSNMNNDFTAFDGNFDKLQDLKILILNQFVARIFNSAHNLRTLTINSTILDDEQLRGFINKFPSIESLSIKRPIIDRLFAEDVSEKLILKLNKLKIQIGSFVLLSTEMNLEQFLLTQVETLKEIEFNTATPVRLINFVIEHLKLHKMIVGMYDDSLPANLKKNLHMKELVIKNELNCSDLLAASPNLSKLHFSMIKDNGIIAYLASTMMKLTLVTFNEFTDQGTGSIQDQYERFLAENSDVKLNTQIQFKQIES